MRAIIPVAGLGSRLKPHTHTMPKVLLNVGGKPIIWHIVDKVMNAGITKATFITGHLGGKIKEYVSDAFPELEADFVEQQSLEGLGHAIYTAFPTVHEEEVFIILGDTIFDVELKPLLAKKCNSIGVKRVKNPERFGVAVTEGNKILRLVEKPAEFVSDLAIVGLYHIVEPEVLHKELKRLVETDTRTRGEIQLTDALQGMLDRGSSLTTFDVSGWYDCGKPETLLATNKHILTNAAEDVSREGSVIIPPVHIDETAVVKNSIIGPFATLDRGVVVENSIVRDSIIGRDSKISSTLLERSLIGTNSEVTGKFKQLNMGDSSSIEFI